MQMPRRYEYARLASHKHIRTNKQKKINNMQNIINEFNLQPHKHDYSFYYMNVNNAFISVGKLDNQTYLIKLIVKFKNGKLDNCPYKKF